MENTSLCFLPAGSLDHIVVLGAGRLAVAVAEFGEEAGIQVSVYGGPRQRDARDPDGRAIEDRLSVHGTRVSYVPSLRDCEGGPHQTSPENALVLSLGSPFIISRDLIDRFEGRVINSHGAPLPEWRGGGGFSWRILAGDRRGNTCFHLVTQGIDDGDVVFERGYEFPGALRSPQQWMDFAFARDRECLLELLQGILDGRCFVLRPQDEHSATYMPRLDSARQGYIDWSWPADEVERFVMAFSHPYDGAKTFIGDGSVRVFECRGSVTQALPHSFFAGLIIRRTEHAITVCCRNSVLDIPIQAIKTEVALHAGDRFTTPPSLLEHALQLRPRYTPSGLAD